MSRKSRHQYRQEIKGRITKILDEKTCTKCQKTLNIEHFSKCNYNSDGRQYMCKSCESSHNKEYNQKNQEKRSQLNQDYYAKNRSKIIAQHKLRRQHNIQTKLADNLRNRLYSAIKLNLKTGSAIRDLGCSVTELKVLLEAKFQTNMTWKNYGFYGWHIDHIIPLDSFDLTDREQLLKACHYTNLQPLWAKENFSKSNKIQSFQESASPCSNGGIDMLSLQEIVRSRR